MEGGNLLVLKNPASYRLSSKSTMAQTDYKFEGWLGLDKTAADGKMVWKELEPKPWEETDVDIKVTHCGICGSDLHTLRSGWVSLNSKESKKAPTVQID